MRQSEQKKKLHRYTEYNEEQLTNILQVRSIDQDSRLEIVTRCVMITCGPAQVVIKRQDPEINFM